MRQLERERRTVWFARYDGKVALKDADGHRTGEYGISYGKPFALRPTVSPRTGNTWGDGFGMGVECDRVAIIDEVGTGVDETCIAWVDAAPTIASDGSLAYSGAEMTSPNDYRVTMVGTSLNYTAIALRKVG